MELKWLFISVMVGAFCVSANYAITSSTAISAGLEECPQFGAGQGGSAIWVKSCSEYTRNITELKKGK